MHYIDGLQALWDKALVDAARNVQGAQESQGDAKSSHDNVRYSPRIGYTEDGIAVYTSNFPEGSTRQERQARILHLVQNVWHKNPIRLEIIEEGEWRTIEAQFDPYVDPDKRVNSDATKLAYGNRKGTMSDQKTTEKLADDFPEIISSSKYVKPKDETGKTTATHQGVIVWNYFANHIGFINEKGGYAEYNVNVDVKHKESGHYVYSFAAEKVKGSERSEAPTLYGDPKTILASGRGIAPAIANTIIPQDTEKGNEKLSTREDQTLTPEFKRWFGKSKVVDTEGKPLVVYHATDSEFTEYMPKHGNHSYYYFAEDKNYSERFARLWGYKNPRYIMAYLSIVRPLDMTGRKTITQWHEHLKKQGVHVSAEYFEGLADSYGDELYGWQVFRDDSGEFRTKIKTAGYDGIKTTEARGDITWVAIDPTQIKSATDNVGTFDPQNPDIRYSRRDADYLDAVERNDMEQAKRMLTEYKGGHAAYPVAQDIVDEFVSEYRGEKFSRRGGGLLNAQEAKRLESNWNDYKYRGYQFTKRPNGGIVVVMDKTMVYTDKKGKPEYVLDIYDDDIWRINEIQQYMMAMEEEGYDHEMQRIVLESSYGTSRARFRSGGERFGATRQDGKGTGRYAREVGGGDFGEVSEDKVSYSVRDADTISSREALANANPADYKQADAAFIADYQKAYRELGRLITKPGTYLPLLLLLPNRPYAFLCGKPSPKPRAYKKRETV